MKAGTWTTSPVSSVAGLRCAEADIVTLGERVEDVFYILDANGRPIEDKEQAYTLENTLRQRLDSQITLSL